MNITMSKKLKNMKWESVALEGFPVSMTDKFQGFVGLEECTNYGLDRESKRMKKGQKKKRKPEDTTHEIPMKKIKLDNKDSSKFTKNQPVRLSNGFIVESVDAATPSLSNESLSVTNKRNTAQKKNKKKPNQTVDTKQREKTNGTADKVKNEVVKRKIKLGDDLSKSVSDLTPVDMLSWAEFKLPEPLLNALMELGFKNPTKIQQLTLPAAIHGRRDILGAAETGSGKTLAFGLPILTGILKLKEKVALGLDAYDITYKKTSVKRKQKEPHQNVKNNKKKDFNKNKKKVVEKTSTESFEDGYASDNESDGDDKNHGISDDKNNVNTNGKSLEHVKIKSIEKTKDDDYIEEIVVPIKRRQLVDDEKEGSDDGDNYIHLSEMFNSDDAADTSDDAEHSDEESDDSEEESYNEAKKLPNEPSSGSESDNELSDDDTENLSGNGQAHNENSSDSEEESDDEATKLPNEASSGSDSDDELSEETENLNEQGIGCVKVVDDVEIPGHVVVKTGKPLYALILTPTRELAIQISRHLLAVAKYAGIRVATIVGGMASVKQERVLRSGPEVVVATPGRLWELISQGQPHLQQLDCVKFLAIDETDRMLERGHFEELQPLLERLNADEARRGTRQNFVFSATLTMVHELPAHMRSKKVTKRGKIINRRIEKMTPQQKIKRLVTMIGMTDPKVVDITTKNLGTAETLTESRITCSLEDKDANLYYILKRHPGRTIVFCNSIGCVRRLAQLFTMLKCCPLPLHASMPQRQRLKNLERFRDDPHGILVATDVAARGLDIPNVDHVVHYQVPRTAENYVHRSGRTARATKEGLTILMMEPSEAFLYAKLCRTLNKTSEVPTFPVAPESLSSLKQLVAAARALDQLTLKHRRAAQAHGWREKVAREMDIIIDDDVLPVKKLDPSIEKELGVRKRQLESMLSRPLFPKGFSFKYPTLNDSTALDVVEENALDVMKKSLHSGELKKEKRKSKNAPLLKLQKQLKQNKKNK